jgi:transcriptional regulator with XRE-family HTH domain
MSTFAEIDARRVALGVSQAELCRRANISEGTYWKAKTGANEPRGRTLRIIERALDSFEPVQGAAE